MGNFLKSIGILTYIILSVYSIIYCTIFILIKEDTVGWYVVILFLAAFPLWIWFAVTVFHVLPKIFKKITALLYSLFIILTLLVVGLIAEKFILMLSVLSVILIIFFFQILNIFSQILLNRYLKIEDTEPTSNKKSVFIKIGALTLFVTVFSTLYMIFPEFFAQNTFLILVVLVLIVGPAVKIILRRGLKSFKI